ncbi:MAG: hypothetical protein K6G03_09635 [Lachnospiraceae bacterium]|nr:hypothetical protein [Lachnospiraceae bacterium]
MDYDKINELLQDEAFLKEMAAKETPDGIKALFDDNGIVIPMSDAQAILDFEIKIKNSNISNEELDRMAGVKLADDELKNVAGGNGYVPIRCDLSFGNIMLQGDKLSFSLV